MPGGEPAVPGGESLRIGLVCPYSLDVPGGVQNHVRDVAEHLSRRGYHVAVLAPGDEDAVLPPYVTVTGKAVPIRYNGAVARLAFGPLSYGRVRRWLRDGRFDLLHVHEPTIPSVSLLALQACEVPVVATFHASNVRSRTLELGSPIIRPALEKITARIAVSEVARANLVQHVGGEPLVIPNGIDHAEFAQAKPKAEWRDPAPTIAFLGRYSEPRKGLGVILEALPEVLRGYPGARLLVAGRGDPQVLDRLPTDIAAHVELLGAVSDADRARLFASVDAYVAPQTGGESFGIVLIEAMAAGAPVVASDLAAFRAVLDEGELGELFPVGDPGALAATLTALLADEPRRRALADRAGRAVLRYDWQRLIGELESVYDTVARSGGARG